MNKKRLAKGLTAAALIGVIAVGSTLAYLSANTGQKTNKFSGDNIGGRTEERFDKDTAENYKPGDSIYKEPTITIDADSADAKVAMSVDYYGDDVETTESNGVITVTNPNEATKMSQKDFERYATVKGWDTDNWEMIATSKNGSELWMNKNTIVTTKKDDVEGSETKDVKTAPLFKNVVVNAGLRTVTETELKSKTVYDKEGNVLSTKEVKNSIVNSYYEDALGNILVFDKLPTFVIDVNGFAVQADHIDAKVELIKLANVGRTAENDKFVAVV